MSVSSVVKNMPAVEKFSIAKLAKLLCWIKVLVSKGIGFEVLFSVYKICFQARPSINFEIKEPREVIRDNFRVT